MDSQGGPGRAGSLVVELAARTVIVDGKRVELPPMEFSLLAVLAARPGEVVPHKELLKEAFGDSAYMDTQDLHWRIWNIRKLIGDTDKTLIRSRRGLGFVLESRRVEVVEGVAATSTDDSPRVIHLEAGEPTAPQTTQPDTQPAEERGEPPRAPLIVLSPAALAIVALVTGLVLGGSWLAGYSLSQRTAPPTTQEEPTTVEAPPPATQERDRDAKRPQRRQAKDRKRPKQKRRDPRSQGSPNFAVGPSGTVGSGDLPSGNVPAAPSGDRHNSQPKPDGAPKEEPPPPPPPPQPNAQLYHLHHPDTGDHIMTTSSSVANQKQAAGYEAGLEGGVFTSQEKGTVAISLDAGTAYVYRDASSAPNGVSVTALYKLSSGDDFFHTASPSAANQAQAQGWARSTAGYVAS